MEYLISKIQSNTSQYPVDVFLAGVAPTSKTLSLYYLNLAKSEIVVTKIWNGNAYETEL